MRHPLKSCSVALSGLSRSLIRAIFPLRSSTTTGAGDCSGTVTLCVNPAEILSIVATESCTILGAVEAVGSGVTRKTSGVSAAPDCVAAMNLRWRSAIMRTTWSETSPPEFIHVDGGGAILSSPFAWTPMLRPLIKPISKSRRAPSRRC